MKTQLATLVFMLSAVLAGCGSYEPAAAPTGSATPQDGQQPGTSTPAATASGQPAGATDDATSPPQPPQPPSQTAAPNTTAIPGAAAPPATTEAPPDRNRSLAQAGVGKKGQGYGGGIITEPIRARFRIEQKVIFDYIKHDMDLFKGLNNRAPKSHEEFMKEIIEANGRELPELPPGEKYVYDPKTEELWVYPEEEKK